MRSVSTALCILALSWNLGQANPHTQASAQPLSVKHLEWGAYGLWGLGMASIFKGYVDDGKGANARVQAMQLYNQAQSGTQSLDPVLYHSLRKEVSAYRASRNQWFGAGAGLILSASLLYGYSLYKNKECTVQLKADGAELQIAFGGQK